MYENPDAVDDIDSFDSDSDDDFHHSGHAKNVQVSLNSEHWILEIFLLVLKQLSILFQGCSDSHNGKLPDVPQRENIYGVHVMRFKEAAGKKMQKLRKNWSLRKNDISNKLSRMRRKSSVDPRGVAVLCKIFAHYDIYILTHITTFCSYYCLSFFLFSSAAPQPSPPRTPPMEKSQSSGQLAGTKYWSFKSKFRRSQSTSVSLGSTFYLTEEVHVGKDSSSRYGLLNFFVAFHLMLHWLYMKHY